MCVLRSALSFLFFTLLLTMNVAASSDRSKRLSNLLFQSVSDNAKLDFAMSKKLLSQFRSDDVITGAVYDDIPFLHHLLNLHRTSTSARDKSDVLEIFQAALSVGADPSIPYKEDPPLLFKAIVLKELHLCKNIVNSSASVVHSLLFGRTQWSSMFVTHLYSLPSESVPLAKLLLHADTIIREKGQSAMGGLDGIKKLLSGASLGKPAVKSVDLSAHSPAYERILSTLGADNDGKIRLLDIIRSLDDLAGSVHQSIVSVLLGDAASALRFVQVITDADQMARAPYPMGRNALHFLCLSGGAVMLEQLGQLLLGLRGEAENAEVLLDGTASASVAAICDELFRKALHAADKRGHTPISYAVMRFSAASPVASALRGLCAQLGLDFDQEVDRSRERGALRPSAPAASEATSVPERVVPDGGWRTTRLAGGAALSAAGTVGTDPRLLEVDSPVLPSNKEFFAQYLNTGSPVIFRSSPVATQDSGNLDSVRATQEVFRKKKFLSAYGDITVPAAAIPYAGTFGKKQVMTTIRQVANSQDPARPSPSDVPLYTFCTPSPQWAPKLLADVPVPRSLRRTAEGTGGDDSGIGAVDAATQSWSFEIQFYLGPAGTGAPAHFHGHAMNTLAYGTKV